MNLNDVQQLPPLGQGANQADDANERNVAKALLRILLLSAIIPGLCTMKLLTPELTQAMCPSLTLTPQMNCIKLIQRRAEAYVAGEKSVTPMQLAVLCATTFDNEKLLGEAEAAFVARGLDLADGYVDVEAADPLTNVFGSTPTRAEAFLNNHLPNMDGNSDQRVTVGELVKALAKNEAVSVYLGEIMSILRTTVKEAPVSKASFDKISEMPLVPHYQMTKIICSLLDVGSVYEWCVLALVVMTGVFFIIAVVPQAELWELAVALVQQIKPTPVV